MSKWPKVNCKQCGAEMMLREEGTLLKCQHCGTPQIFEKDGLVFHYYVEKDLDDEEARKVLKEWMSRPEKARDLNLKAEITNFNLKFVPLWFFKFEKNGKEIISLERADQNLLEWHSLKLPPGDLNFFDDKKIQNALEPTISLWNALAIQQVHLGFTGLQDRGELKEKALVHFPVYFATYSFGGETYEATVDGASGEVFGLIFPKRKEEPFFTLLFGALVLLTLLSCGVVFGPSNQNPCCITYLIGILLTFAAAMVVAERY